MYISSSDTTLSGGYHLTPLWAHTNLVRHYVPPSTACWLWEFYSLWIPENPGPDRGTQESWIVTGGGFQLSITLSVVGYRPGFHGRGRWFPPTEIWKLVPFGLLWFKNYLRALNFTCVGWHTLRPFEENMLASNPCKVARLNWEQKAWVRDYEYAYTLVNFI